MDNFVFAMEKSYNYMLEEINEILDGTIYSDNERKRLFYACGSCLHLILDFAERIKDMTTMNRWYCLYSESDLSAHLAERELGFSLMHSSIDKHKRGNCVIDTGLQ